MFIYLQTFFHTYYTTNMQYTDKINDIPLRDFFLQQDNQESKVYSDI